MSVHIFVGAPCTVLESTLTLYGTEGKGGGGGGKAKMPPIDFFFKYLQNEKRYDSALL